MPADFELKGVEELTKALQGLNKRMANQIVKRSMVPITAQMVNLAQRFAPKGATKRLSSSIMARNRFVRSGTVFTSDALVHAPSREEGAFYAHFVEFGHRVMGFAGDGSTFVKAQPFWEPSFRATYGPDGSFGVKKAQDSMAKGITDYLERTVPKGK